MLTSLPAPRYPSASFQALRDHIGQVNLDDLVCCFLFFRQNPTYNSTPPLPQCPSTNNVTRIHMFHSATATFCAPSNPSGVGGSYRESIRCTPRWQTANIIAPQHDCILLNTNPDTAGMRGLDVARVHLFSFELGDKLLSCALVHNFSKSFNKPEPDNGMWVVEPNIDNHGYQVMSVMHIDSIVCAAHLLPVFKGDAAIPRNVNKHVDYHVFETLF